jgi:hypothetical protein
MDVTDMAGLFQGLTTPHVADACLRSGVEVRCAPSDLRPLRPSFWVAGPVRPARHYGSVDMFLEALEHASPGEVLVIDNAGRRDEACVGDLIALETKLAGLAGMVIWGLHRDTYELVEIGLNLSRAPAPDWWRDRGIGVASGNGLGREWRLEELDREDGRRRKACPASRDGPTRRPVRGTARP